MIYEEALEIITNTIQTDKITAEQDTALAVAQKALQKQMAKKPIPNEKDNIRFSLCYSCPECGRTFSGTGIADYCYHCGQALDWSEE